MTIHVFGELAIVRRDSTQYVVCFKTSLDISYIHQDLQLKASAIYLL